MRRPKPAIRTTLRLILGALVCLVAALSFERVYSDARQLKAIEDLRAAAALANQVMETAHAVSLTRDITLAMLSTNDAAAITALRPRLDAARTETDRSWRALLTMMRRESHATYNPLLRQLTASQTRAAQMRPQIDAMMAMPSARRAALSRQWSVETTNALDGAQALWQAVAARHAQVDPVATLHMRFMNSLRSLRDHASRERTIVAIVLARGVESREAVTANLLREQGAMEEAWRLNRSAAEQSGLYGAIATLHVAAMRDSDQLHTLALGAVANARAENGPKLLTWFARTDRVYQSLDALSHAAQRTTQDHLTHLTDRTARRMMLHALLTVAGLALCIASIWLVTTRVINPIDSIVGALKTAIRGERAVFARPLRGGAEIDALVEVLQSYQRLFDDARRDAQALARSEAYLRAIFENAVSGLLAIDQDGIIQQVNPEAERLFQRPAVSLVGSPVGDIIPALPARLAALSPDTHGLQSEYLGIRTAHDVFPLEASISCFPLDGGCHFSAIVRDVTARKSAENAVLASMHALERSNKELDDFAYIASHDLKEPLRGIHNHARFLLEDHGDALGPESVNRLNRLVLLSQRMERLISDLLYFSRLGRQDLAMQPADMSSVVKDAEIVLETFLEDHNASVIRATPLPITTCNRTRVTEIFHNLITNGVKYNDSAVKRVEIGHLPHYASPEGASRTNVFFVRDNGIGIAPEFHGEIFRIFRRLQAANKDGRDGTGVGLTFVKKIIERHGGEIWLQSAPGQGATFFFTLCAPHEQNHAREFTEAA